MNYYNYFTEIEDTFIRRRGKNLLLGPLDWAMIDAWRERGIPLHIVLRAIEAVFDNFDKNPRPRSIKSLMFCREEVEAQYAEWTASRIGADTNASEQTETAISSDDIRSYISRSVEQLRAIERDDIAEDLERACFRLEELEKGLTDDLEFVDRSLNDIEKFLEAAIMERTDRDHLKRLEKEVSAELREYKRTMEKDKYDDLFQKMLLKRLRDDADIPRLGLFYM